MAVSLVWTVTVTNTSDTAATVKVVLKAKSTYGSYNNNSRSGYIIIDGTKYTFSHSFSANTTTTIATKSKSISRTTSSKSVSIKASYSTGVSSGTITKSGSTTVAARPAYTVTFNANGGTGGKSVSVYSGYTTTFPTTSRTGYTFGSWNGYAQGAATPAITSSRTYTASWTINTYKVTLDAQSGSVSSTSYTKTYGTNLSLPTPTRTGYYFGGWWTGTNGTGTNYNTTYTANAAATLYAKWTLNQYVITFNSDGGSAVANMTKTHGSSVSLPTPTKEGYTFAGWKYGDTNIGTTCSINGSSNNAQIALVAVWNANAKRIILHYYESTTDINSTAVVYKIKDENYNLNNIELPDVSNYIFKGWYTSSNFTTKVTTLDSSYDSASYPTTEVIDLYAKWNPTYNVVFNPNPLPYEDGIDVVGYVAPIIVENGISTSLPSYTNYTYKKGEETKATAISWNSAANGSGTTYTNSIQLTGLTAGATYNLYAQWRRESFTQTFTRGEATSGNNYTITANYYDTINLPAAQSDWVYDQHSFSHWTLQKDNTGHIYNESFLVTENNTFVAQWTLKYTAPQINITAIRTVDEEGEFPSESGRYVKINLSGQNGEYENVSVTNYTYSIEAKFFNSEGTELQTIKQSYEKGTTQAINEIKIFNDKKFTYDSCIITFIDTTNYNDLLPLDDSNRIYIYSFQIPLTRGIAIHIADDLSAIGVLGELNDNDKGLVIKGLSYFEKEANFEDTVIFKNTIFNELATFNNNINIASESKINNNITIDSEGRVNINAHDINGQGIIQVNNDIDATDTMIRVQRTDKNVKVGFGIGSGGINHGIWSTPLNKWLVYGDDKYCWLQGAVYTGSMPGGSGVDHKTTIQNYFTNNMNTIPRSALTGFYSSALGNGSVYMGYFLKGYDRQDSIHNEYGGFYVAHYNTPYYVGISNGTYTQQNILTSTNTPMADYVITNTTTTGKASGASTANVTWRYRKWHSGRVEMWAALTIACTASTSDGGGYRTPYLAISIPSGILGGRPMVWCSIQQWNTSTAILTPIGSGMSATSTGSWAGLRGNSITASQEHIFSFYVVYPI